MECTCSLDTGSEMLLAMDHAKNHQYGRLGAKCRRCGKTRDPSREMYQSLMRSIEEHARACQYATIAELKALPVLGAPGDRAAFFIVSLSNRIRAFAVQSPLTAVSMVQDELRQTCDGYFALHLYALYLMFMTQYIATIDLSRFAAVSRQALSTAARLKSREREEAIAKSKATGVYDKPSDSIHEILLKLVSLATGNNIASMLKLFEQGVAIEGPDSFFAEHGAVYIARQKARYHNDTTLLNTLRARYWGKYGNSFLWALASSTTFMQY